MINPLRIFQKRLIERLRRARSTLRLPEGAGKVVDFRHVQRLGRCPRHGAVRLVHDPDRPGKAELMRYDAPSNTWSPVDVETDTSALREGFEEES